MLYTGSGLNMREELLVLPFFFTTTQKLWDPVIMAQQFEPLKNDLLLRTAWGMIFIIHHVTNDAYKNRPESRKTSHVGYASRYGSINVYKYWT